MPELSPDSSETSFSKSYAALTEANRFRLRLILALTALATIAIIIFLGLQERQHIIRDYERISQNAVSSTVASQSKIISDTQVFLKELSKAPALLDLSQTECSDFLATILAITPQYVNIGAPGANGDLLCNALPLSRPVNVSDRPYIRKALDQKVFSISTFQVDRAAQASSMNFAYPILDPSHPQNPIGAAVAVVSLDWWTTTLERLNLPQGTVAFVLDSEDAIIASYPANIKTIGTKLDGIGFEQINGTVASGQVVLGEDGVSRIFNRSRLFDDENNKVFMTLGVPVDAGVSAANKAMIGQMLAFGGIWALVWLITMRQLNRIVFRPANEMIQTFEQIERDSGSSITARDLIDPNASQDVHDVTHSFLKVMQDRTQAQAERAVQTERLTALIGALPDTYFRVDYDGKLLDCRTHNPSDLLLPTSEFIGKNLADVLPPDILDEFNERLREYRRTGELVEYEYNLEFPEGTKHFEARISAIAGANEIVIVVRNITNRKNSDKQRHAAEARLERILTNLPGATISLNLQDPSNPIPIYLSPQIEDIWGYSVEEAMNDFSILSSAHDPDDLDNILAKLTSSSKTLKPFQHRFKITTKFGEEKWLETNTGAAVTADGSVQTDGFVLDVTKEVQSQKQLNQQREVAHQAQKHESVGQLTGGVAHDFNNLLAVIMGNLELLRDELDDEHQLELIDAGIRASLRGADLTRNMLAFARKARLEPKTIQLNKLVSETRSWSGRTLPSSISIETSLLAGLWDIEADPSSTESALLNLILNARDAMPNGGKLTIETANIRIDQPYVDSRKQELKPGRYVMLAVSDTGSGIPKNTLKHIFEPFYSTKPPGSGSGLGLSMIHGFMNQSGGTVQVYTEAGVGSTFKLFFRAIGSKEAPPEEAETTRNLAATPGQRILVAEDEPDVLAVIATTLEAAGYDVTRATSGDIAFEIFQADPTFDLLLTDIVMPGTLQGTNLSKELRKIAPALPAVFMSGYASEATVHGNGLRPEDIRLMKPVTRVDLLSSLSKALNNK